MPLHVTFAGISDASATVVLVVPQSSRRFLIIRAVVFNSSFLSYSALRIIHSLKRVYGYMISSVNVGVQVILFCAGFLREPSVGTRSCAIQALEKRTPFANML